MALNDPSSAPIKIQELARTRLLSVNIANRVDMDSSKRRIRAEVFKRMLESFKSPRDGYVKIPQQFAGTNSNVKKAAVLKIVIQRFQAFVNKFKNKR